MNIIFMGTPDFAKKSLEKLIETKKHNILAVVTNPDRPKGRGRILTASPVKELAIANGIKVLQPEKIKANTEFINEIREMDPDLIVVVAYGKILPKEILEIPKKGAINVHGSILPKYRGAAPIQWALINGDKTTGVTTMYMSEGMDEGDILLIHEIPIEEDDTSGTLFVKLAEIGADLLIETIDRIEEGNIEARKQEGDISYAPMINKELSLVNWNSSGCDIVNLVRALNPFMCCHTYIKGKRYKILKAKEVSKEEIAFLNEENDKNIVENNVFIIDNRLFFETFEEFVEILEIQEEGKKVLKTLDFLRGKPFD